MEVNEPEEYEVERGSKGVRHTKMWIRIAGASLRESAMTTCGGEWFDNDRTHDGLGGGDEGE